MNLNGLSENMPEALKLLEHLLQHAKADKDAYQQFVGMEAKNRADAKLEQQANFYRLVNYGLLGSYNPNRNDLSIEQLMQTNPQELLDLLKDLSKFEHTLLYYGPMSEKELSAAVKESHLMPDTYLPVPEGKHYQMQSTPQNEVFLAPYDAKNIYMRMIHNELRPWNPDEAAVKALFNEYYGGGMNTIVFQEMREARGLAYNAWAAYIDPIYKNEPEYFFTHIITQNDKMMDCVNQFLVILDDMPQSEPAFKIAKEALTKRLASQRTTKFGLINAWLNAKNLGIDYDINERIYKALPNLTLKDIADFERLQMAKKPFCYVILGNEKDLDMKALGKIGPIRRLSTEEIFGY